MVHRDISIHIGPDEVYVEGNGEVLLINRQTGSIDDHKSQTIPTQERVVQCLGLFGMIRLPSGNHLVVIKKAKKVGELSQKSVFQVEETEIIAITPTKARNQGVEQDNATFVAMLNQVLATPAFYFSYELDLTHTQQRLAHTTTDFRSHPLIQRADHRFIWNGHMLQPFLQRKFYQFCLPIIHGFVAIKPVFLNSCSFDWVIISRRSIYRVGTRYFVRGADLDGNVANYVETEQLVQFNKSVVSFVLTRGSIPFQWTQRPNIKYKPKPKLKTQNDQLLIYKRHIDEQVVLYGRQVLVNLIDQKGGEKLLESQFSDIYHRADNKKVRYVHFDFHKECSKMRWHRLSILMDKLKQDIEDHGYYFSTNESTLQRQTGVFRVNCIDCLDRTNVVQSMLAKTILEEQLLKLGVFKQGNSLSSFPQFESTYRNVWADNADACSTQYSGTGALKTDYTRTGTRTKLGLLQDGRNSAVRYYKNNFCDGYRQDSLDFFLGNFVWEDHKVSPFRDSAQLKVRIIPILALVSLSMAIIGVLLPPSESFAEQMLFIFFWILTGVGSCLYVLRHGPYYVNQPLLVHKLQKDI